MKYCTCYCEVYTDLQFKGRAFAKHATMVGMVGVVLLGGKKTNLVGMRSGISLLLETPCCDRHGCI